MKKWLFLITMITALFIVGCSNDEVSNRQSNANNEDTEATSNTGTSDTKVSDDQEDFVRFNHGEWLGVLTNDKASYDVGEQITFNLLLNSEKDFNDKNITIKYTHLTELIEEEELAITDDDLTWKWTPPKEDFSGYMVEVYLEEDGEAVDHLNIAVDVSSEWTKFPRFGYLADYGSLSEDEQTAVIERLNRFHINSLQFYDWKDLHHIPARIENGELVPSWTDIANRDVMRETVERYIDLAHERNMKAMSYNLIFGANKNYEEDGVQREWGLYNEPDLETQNSHDLPDSWKSDIYLMDPANREWQDYIIGTHKDVFNYLDFDGWHGDQLGHRGTLYDYEGNAIEIYETYAPFMNYAKEQLDVYMGLNAVSMYGAEEIATSSVDYAYVEAWDQTRYSDLKEIIDFHWDVTDGQLNTVLAAYMNYELAGLGKTDEFNTPGVLFTDAVIFASGGNHIELGENMLGREYFPDKTLSIPAELEHRLVRYYDFAVAYQNLLRDDIIEVDSNVSSSDLTISDNVVLSTVWNFTKQKDNKDIHHFINFTDAMSLSWKDDMGTQPAPKVRQDTHITIETNQEVAKVWYATPDYAEGSAIALSFSQEVDELSFELPFLEYWSMVVVEYVD